MYTHFLTHTYTHTLTQIHANKYIIYVHTGPQIIDLKNVSNVFYYFYKKRVLTFFYFLERFLFSNGEFFYPTEPAKILLNLLNFCIKRLLSYGFNMAAIKILS